MLCRLVILALFIACVASIVGAGVCPCSDSPIEHRNLAKEHALCIYFEKELESQENLIKRTKHFTTEAGLATESMFTLWERILRRLSVAQDVTSYSGCVVIPSVLSQVIA